MEESHSDVLAVIRPPLGSLATMKMARPKQVITADHQARAETDGETTGRIKKREDQFGHQQRLDDGEGTEVEGQCLEHERRDEGAGTEEPHRLAEEVEDQALALHPVWGAPARQVLGHHIRGVAQGREEGEKLAHCGHGRCTRPRYRPGRRRLGPQVHVRAYREPPKSDPELGL